MKIVRTLILILSSAIAALGSPLPTAPPVEGEIRFAALGDAGTGGPNQKRIAETMENVRKLTRFDLLVFLGDNIYENGSPKDIEKKFLRPYAPLIDAGVEFRGAIGNHDARSKHGILLQQLIFRMGPQTYYKFPKEESLVEFFALDTTKLIREKENDAVRNQLQWFESSLRQSDAHWKIAFMHHPIFSSAKKHGFTSSRAGRLNVLRERLLPLYRQYGVDLSINGHDHVYERVKPFFGIRFFTSGAGAKLRTGNLRRESPFLDFGVDDVRSFMLFSVTKEKIRFWAIDINGKVIDSGEITKTSRRKG